MPERVYFYPVEGKKFHFSDHPRLGPAYCLCGKLKGAMLTGQPAVGLICKVCISESIKTAPKITARIDTF